MFFNQFDIDFAIGDELIACFERNPRSFQTSVERVIFHRKVAHKRLISSGIQVECEIRQGGLVVLIEDGLNLIQSREIVVAITCGNGFFERDIVGGWRRFGVRKIGRLGIAIAVATLGERRHNSHIVAIAIVESRHQCTDGNVLIARIEYLFQIVFLNAILPHNIEIIVYGVLCAKQFVERIFVRNPKQIFIGIGGGNV